MLYDKLFILNVKMVRKCLNFDPKCIEMRSVGKKESTFWKDNDNI